MIIEFFMAVIAVFQLIFLILLMYIVMRMKRSGGDSDINQIKREINEANSLLRQELSGTTSNAIAKVSEVVSTMQKNTGDQLESRLKTFESMNEVKLENIRTTVEKRLSLLQDDNNRKLDEMRNTVDKKLQDTLDNKLTQSFKLVSERLEEVHKGLGEMQSVAIGVNDLKKVLSNVKSRGVLGEVQLSALLSNILVKTQYVENFPTKVGSNDRVEFAVKLPTSKDDIAYLPIDAKFPADKYIRLQDAYNEGGKERIDEARKELEKSLTASAQYIRDKYIDPPNTVEFGILFLPFEGLYSEASGLGVIDKIQQEYRIIIAGPSNMAALLNTLQMMYKVVDIQERASDVWKVLSTVKAEFGKFTKTLANAQSKIDSVGKELDNLVGVRSRQMMKTLQSVDTVNIAPSIDIINAIEGGGLDDDIGNDNDDK